jgi:hypothetical protein
VQSPAHFLIGAGICRHVRCRPLGLALACASHYALDALPHFEDPSILPPWLAHVAGAHWSFALAGAQVAVGCLAAFVWRRCLQDRGTALYLVGGGLLACLPDYLYWVGGLEGVLRELNSWSHQWWNVPYLRLVRSDHGLRPLVAGWCLVIEALVCAAGALALFGSRDRSRPPEPRP